MDTTYIPHVGDSVFLHREDNAKVGSFYSVIDVNKDTMAVQSAHVVGDHLEETDNLDIIVLNWNKKLGSWVWDNDRYKPRLIATFMQQTDKIN